jgi:hypothetical protein
MRQQQPAATGSSSSSRQGCPRVAVLVAQVHLGCTSVLRCSPQLQRHSNWAATTCTCSGVLTRELQPRDAKGLSSKQWNCVCVCLGAEVERVLLWTLLLSV